MTPEIHIEEIKQLLDGFVKEAPEKEIRGNRNWTFEIKRRLGELGGKYNYEICGLKDHYDAEWLYDFVWYQEEGEGENSRLVDVPLVVESEWSMHLSDIKYDFEKLLVANAALKLMICQVKAENKDFIFNYFKDAISKYRGGRKEDKFLIAMLDHKEEVFSYETLPP